MTLLLLKQSPFCLMGFGGMELLPVFSFHVKSFFGLFKWIINHLKQHSCFQVFACLKEEEILTFEDFISFSVCTFLL